MNSLPASIDHSRLPSIAHAQLPQVYEQAKAALAECERIDECKDWADKAAALASYAKQSQDMTLERHAMRIKARAIQRAGELLQAIPADPGGRPSTRTPAAVGQGFRSEVARDAGMSERQQKQAVNVSRVPKGDFERQVDSDRPPTITALAEQGRKPRPVVDHTEGRDPKAWNRAMHFVGDCEGFAKMLDEADLDTIAEGMTPAFLEELEAAIEAIRTALSTVSEKLL